MIKLDKDVILTDDIILKIVRNHKGREFPRLCKLKRYYEAKNDILMRVQMDETKPNNRIANAYAGYITDTLVGYFVGEPITYNCKEDAVLTAIQNIFEYNDEADENTELAKNASIYGVAYEELYFDEEGKLRFNVLPTEECIPIYDTTIENNLLYFIRYYMDYDITTDTRFYWIEVINEDSIVRYKSNEMLSSLTDRDEEAHYFKMVPIAIYKNNEEQLGDFERVLTLIDAYDKLESDTLNDFEYFTDAYLALYGFTAEPEDVKKMKENRVLLMDEGTSAEWLIKNSDGTSTENTKNRIDKDIHKFSFCPNLSDENFASNASGVAIKFKTMGTENLVSIKERKFKKGLQQRLELISMVDAMLGAGFDWRTVDIVFSRNLPANDSDAADMISKLEGIVSDETLLSQLSFVDNIQEELERVKKQRDEEKETNPLLQSLSYQTGAMTSYSKQKIDEQENKS